MKIAIQDILQDVQYPERLHDLHNDLLIFFKKRWKFKKVEKLVANFHDKKICHTYKKFKQALNLGLVLKKFIELQNSIKSLTKVIH